MNRYALHPEAFTDLDDIAAYLGQDSASAARRLMDEIDRAIEGLVSFPEQGFAAPIWRTVRCASSSCAIT